ncbi:MAG: glycosyltransferase family 39 protein, partial [Anaerolineae bacterium]|nr:glycosyltransferase family 39 protein [Anaerolineae bacterium]
MKRPARDRLLLLFSLLAGTVLRLFRLGADSLWYDETVSTLLAGSPLPELIRHTAGDIHPPFYYLLLRGWLIAMGYPTGHADPNGIGLEFAAGFFSLFFGVLLIALTYVMARRFAGTRAAFIAAALVALSPYHIWYGQEVRMYTLAAGLGVVATLALAAGIQRRTANVEFRAWAIYAMVAAAGMYTLYYFAFLLIALNVWALAYLALSGCDRRSPTVAASPSSHRTFAARRSTFAVSRLPFTASRFVATVAPLLLANLAAAFLYAPWIPIALRQATDPPVPPWRTAPTFLASVSESWNALALGQAAPTWTWP